MVVSFLYKKMAINYVSQEGFDSLKEQIEQLEKVDRKKISNQIAYPGKIVLPGFKFVPL